jgi:hypothetical protein
MLLSMKVIGLGVMRVSYILLGSYIHTYIVNMILSIQTLLKVK